MMRWAILLGMLGGPVMAEGFTIQDFGPFETRAACMGRIQSTLNTYAVKFGIPDEIDAGEWTVIAWDLAPGDTDVVFSCPNVAGNVNAFIHAYSPSDDGDDARLATVTALREIFVNGR